MNDGREELPRKMEEEKKICWEEVRKLRVAMVVVMKQLKSSKIVNPNKDMKKSDKTQLLDQMIVRHAKYHFPRIS